MKIFNIDKNFKNVPKINEKFNLCLGFFDGIHLGHRKIIAAASKNGNKIGIITFVRKNNVEKYITPINERLDFFKKLNISFVFVLPFSKKIMNISHFFFKKNFLDVIKPTILFAGEDFKFGKNRLGNIEYLKKFFSVKVIKFKKKNNEKISSSKIKEMIIKGNINEANKNLGYGFKIFGKIIKKDENFYIFDRNDKILPLYGFYKVFFKKKSKKKFFLIKIYKEKITIIADHYFLSYLSYFKKINFELIRKIDVNK